MTHLRGGTVVEGYRIERELGSGGFGVTYLARDQALKRLLALKEYFPTDFAERQGKSTVRARPGRGEDFAWAKERFIEEARILARFDHPNIVRVARVFSANNTAYIVEDFQGGRSLKDWLRDLDEPPTQSELDLLLTPILDALSTIHANDVLHRDLAPDNIYVCDDGSPVLLDFGSAREAIAQRTKTISSVVKTGYSPPEQYSTTGKSQGPWTDIYALGATLYHAVAGKPPDEASDRVLTDDLVPATRAARRVYRAGFLEAIDWALRVDTKRRPQSVSDWRKALLDDRGSFERAAAAPTPQGLAKPGSSAAPPVVAIDDNRLAPRFEPKGQRPQAPTVPAAKSKSLLWLALALVLGLVLAVAGSAILMRQKPQDLAIKPPAEATTPPASEPPAKIAERVEATPANPAAPAPSASEPKADPSAAQGAPANPAAATQNPPAAAPAPAPSAGRAAMLVASADNPQKPVVSLGSTVWSLIPAASGQPATVAVKAEADIPDLKMHATMTLRKNTDPTLQATHTIDLKFSFADGAPIAGFKDVGLPQLRMEDSTAAEALTSVKVKISDTYFLIALAKGDSDTARNLDLMRTRAWFDFPLLLNDDRIAKVVFQKSAEGQAMLEKAFEAWK